MAVRQRKPAEDRKAEIVATAIRLASRIGPDRVTAESLARAIGISQPAIFRHFANKQAIWQAVAARISVLLDAEAERNRPGGGAADRLRALVARHLSHLAQNPAIPAILFSRELHADNEGLRAAFAGIMSNRQQVFAAIIRDGCASGEFRSDLDVEAAATLVLTLVQGTALRWSLDGRQGDLVETGLAMLETALAGFGDRGAAAADDTPI